MKMLVAVPLVALSFTSVAACGGKQPLPSDVGAPTTVVDPAPVTSADPSTPPTSLPAPTGDQGAPPPPPVDTASPGT